MHFRQLVIPKRDQHKFSLSNTNTQSRQKVMRINKIINYGNV